MAPALSAQQMLEAAVRVAEASGLRAVTFGRVAREAGCSDRMVAYYFRSTRDLLAAVLVHLGQSLREVLDTGIPLDNDDCHMAAAAAWPLLATPGAARSFGLLFEAIGLQSAGVAPYDELVPLAVNDWLDWLAPRFPRGDGRAEAAALLAVLDGLLLLRQMAGPDVAQQAAELLLPSRQGNGTRSRRR